MSILVYFFVLLVAAGSVLFGLDWMQAPLQPPARPERATQATVMPQSAASAATSQASAGSTAPQAAALPAGPIKTAGERPRAVTTTSMTGAPPSDNASERAPSDALKAQASDTKPAPLCDIAACERAYHTFTPADCTYKPYDGPRRLCTKGNPPRRPSAELAANEAHAQARCNISACESAYQSFDPATCTYQPYDSPRRLCMK